MRLAIVGSTSLADNEQVRAEIRDLIASYRSQINDEHEEFIVVSGGARGVDTMAEEEARALGIPIVVFPPKTQHWAGPGGYRERNFAIAHYCTHLIRIASVRSKTYGSGWTRDRAQELGRVILPERLIGVDTVEAAS